MATYGPSLEWGFFCCFALLCADSYALETPLRDPSALPEAKTAPVLHLATARVAVKDVPLINRDFPETVGLSDEALDQWLIKNAGFICESQVSGGRSAGTQTEVRLDPSTSPRVGYRPKGYGRAMVIPVPAPSGMPGGGLLDIKGVGAESPELGHHKDGLTPLGEGLREFFLEKLVQKVFDDEYAEQVLGAASAASVIHNRTVGTYAVLDTGFDVNRPNQNGAIQPLPSSLVVRQAHVRSQEPHAMLKPADAIRIEKILREYGISTTVYKDQGGGPEPMLNVQGTVDGDVIDFGSYFIYSGFGANVFVCREQQLKPKIFKQILRISDVLKRVAAFESARRKQKFARPVIEYGGGPVYPGRERVLPEGLRGFLEQHSVLLAQTFRNPDYAPWYVAQQARQDLDAVFAEIDANWSRNRKTWSAGVFASAPPASPREAVSDDEIEKGLRALGLDP